VCCFKTNKGQKKFSGYCRCGSEDNSYDMLTSQERMRDFYGRMCRVGRWKSELITAQLMLGKFCRRGTKYEEMDSNVP
jgi:hypothetical protein